MTTKNYVIVYIPTCEAIMWKQ